ncbi:MAG: hypothetical protein DLM58_24165 [Pseudonocardiales bacterium]|nr:MAG: hypothetical protein DLM58_24165 [Pseudonocardiales bacterium]
MPPAAFAATGVVMLMLGLARLGWRDQGRSGPVPATVARAAATHPAGRSQLPVTLVPGELETWTVSSNLIRLATWTIGT